MSASRWHTAVALALSIAGCASETSIAPLIPSSGAAQQQYRVLAFTADIDRRTGTIVITSPTGGTRSGPTLSVAGGEAPALSLLGGDAVRLVPSNYRASAVGEFAPNRVRVTFDVSIENKLPGVALTTPTWPVPPFAGVILFPLDYVVTTTSGGVAGSDGNAVIVELPNVGGVAPSVDWNGAGFGIGLSGISGEPFNFFNDTDCASTPSGDCFRWEAFDSVIPPVSGSATRTVGFDVDASVGQFRARMIVAADLAPPPVSLPRLRIVSGGSPPPDTIGTLVIDPLIVELRDENGAPVVRGSVTAVARPAPGRDFETGIQLTIGVATPVGCAGVTYNQSFAFASTGADGRAGFCLRRALIAGQGQLSFRTNSPTDSATASITILPGRAMGVRAASDTAVSVGAVVQLRANVVDRAGNARTEFPLAVAAGANVVVVPGAIPAVSGVAFGTEWVQLAYGPYRDSTLVAVVPEGRVLIWNFDAKSIELRNLDGSTVRTVSESSQNIAAIPRFDVQRSRAVFVTEGSTFGPNRVVLVDTTGLYRRLIDQGQTIERIQSVTAMPDGSLLLLATPARQSPSIRSSELRVWRVSPDNSIREVARVPDGSFSEYTADISPDGTKLAYIVSDLTRLQELWVLDLQTGLTRVLTQNAFAPRWSPSGDRIAYLSIASATSFPPSTGELFTVRADGTQITNMSGTVRFSPGLTWSPDQTYVMGRTAIGPWQVHRLSDSRVVVVPLRTATGAFQTLLQPDWR